MSKDENDYELLYMIRQKDEAAFLYLIEKYDATIRYIIYKYMKKSCNGVDVDDYYQIALMKLTTAIDAFRGDREASFAYFYIEILTHSLIDCYRWNRSAQGNCESFAISLDKQVQDGSRSYSLTDFISTNDRAFIKEEEPVYQLFCETKKELSDLENSILDLRSFGYSYKQIASILDINEKKVDNTLCKVRNKKRKETMN
ncbi:MAG: sigma-70 family RNA polymerase sigma factor [Longicatena sp.]